MKQPDALQLFWDLAQLDSPVLTHDDVMRFPKPVREALFDAGLLKPTRTARSAECDGCDLGTVGEVFRFSYPDGRTRMFIMCPECGRVPIHPDRLRQWVPDYARVASLLGDTFACTGGAQEVVPNRLWNMGRAAIARQSRTLWLARRVTEDLHPSLPTDGVSVLFIMGVTPRTPPALDPDRVFEVRHLATLGDGMLRFDADAVTGQVESVVAATETAPAPPKKRAPRAAAIDLLKKVLHEEILSRKSLLSRHWDDNLPPVQQKQLASLIGTSPASVYRALKDDDRELQWLWRIVHDPRQIVEYRG